MTTTMRIVRAADTRGNLEVLLGLIDEARDWLGNKDTNQWSRPWPDRASRDDRVRRGLQGGKTWIVWHEEIPVATVTIATRPNPLVWSGPACQCNLSERAVYAHRLIVARDYAGWGLGAELIDWAGLRGRREYGAGWIRIDVWTTNTALHRYYTKTGFEPCGSCADPDYPSGALFQKPVSRIAPVSIPHVTGSSADFELAGLQIPAFA